jgi:DNA gyrase inhibitor GyrI
MNKLQKTFWLLTGRGVPGDHLDEPDTYKGHEIPAYDVERRLGDVEIRHYPDTLVAETEVDGEGQDALSEGFRRLAGYIFGKNVAKTSVAMTAPVGRTSQTVDMTAPVGRTRQEGSAIVSFTLPRNLTLDTAPVPLDDRVRVRRDAGGRRAVLRFSGRGRSEDMDAQAKRLRAVLKENDIAWHEPAIEMRYDDPSTLPHLRRNEVAFALD